MKWPRYMLKHAKLIVDEIRQVATLPSWPHYPSLPYICLSSLYVLTSIYTLFKQYTNTNI